MVFLYILSMFGFKPLLVITVVLLGWVSSRSTERGMFYQFQNQNDLCVCIRNGLPANQGHRKILVDMVIKDYWNQQSERFLKLKETLQNLINKYLFGVNSDEVNFLNILNMPQELSELNEENILNDLDPETINSPEDGVEPSEQRKMLTTSGSEPNSDKPNDLTNESRFVWHGPEQASHRLNNYAEFSNQQYPLKLSQFGSIPLNDFTMELDNIPRQPYETIYPLNSKPSELVNSGYPVNPNPYITWNGNGNFINPQSPIRLFDKSKQYPELQNLPETYQNELVPQFKPFESPEEIQSGFSPLSENPSDDPYLNKGSAMITNEPLQNFPRQRLIEDDEYSYPDINYKLQQKKPMFHSGGSQPSSKPEEPINPNDEYKWVSDPFYNPQKKPMPSYQYFPERRRYEGLPFGTRDELKQDLTYLIPEQQEIEYLSDKEEADIYGKINYNKWLRLEPDYPIRQPERRIHTSLDIYAQPNPENLETENIYTKQQNFPRQPNQAKPTNSGEYEIQDVPYGAVDTFPVEEQISEGLELPEEKKPIQMNPNNLGVQKVKSPKSRKNIGPVPEETSNEYLKWPRLESTYPFRQPEQRRHTSLDVYVQPNPEDLETENIYTKEQNYPSDIYDYQPKNKPKERQPNQAKPTNSGEYKIQSVPNGAVDTFPVEEQISEELELPEGKKPVQVNPNNLGIQKVKSPKSRKNIGPVPEEIFNEYQKWPRLESTYPFRQPNLGRHTSLDVYVQPNPEDLEIENVYTKQENFPSDIDYQSKRYKPKDRQPNQAQPTNLGDQNIQNISYDVNDESDIEEHISEELNTPKKRQPNQVEPINLGVQKGKSPKSRKNRIPVSSDLTDNYMFQKPRMKPRYQTRKPKNKQPSNLGFQTQQISEEPKMDYFFTKLSPSDDYFYNYQPKTHKRKNRKPKQVKPKPTNLGDEVQSVPYERINFSPEEEQIFEELQITKDRKPVQVESNNLGVQGMTSLKNRRNMVKDTDDNLRLQSRYPNRKPKQEQPLNLGLQVEPVPEELMIEDLATQPQMESSDIFGYQPKRYKPRNKKPKQNQPINLGDPELPKNQYEINFSKEEDTSEELEANEVRKSVQVEPNNLNLQSSSVMYDSQEPTYKFPQDGVQEDINYDFKVGTDNLKDQESLQSVNGFGQINLGDIQNIHGSSQEQLHSFQEIEKLQGIPDLHNFKDFQNIGELTKDGIPKTIKFGHNLSTRTIYTDVPQVSKIQWKQTVPIGFKMIQSSSSGPIKYTQRSTTKIIPNLEQEPMNNESIETIQNGNGFRKTIKRVTIGQKRKMNSQRGGMSFSGRKSFVFGSSGDFPTGIMRKRVGQITEGIPM